MHTTPFSEKDGPGRSLQAVVDLVKETGADMLLVAGDVFDHNKVIDELVYGALQEFARAEVPVILLPGNHDCLQEETVYRRLIPNLAANCRVLYDPLGESLSFPDLDLGVWGQPLLDYGGPQRPLGVVPQRGPERWQIAMAHGHYVGDSDNKDRSFLISRDEVLATGRDYVALGHWDRFFPAVEETVPAFYSGAPLHTRATLLVELHHRDGVSVKQVPLTIT